MKSIRSLAAFMLALTLAACGGGGGGGGGSSSGTGGSVTPPGPSSGNMTQQSVQRADVQSSLAGVQAVREYSGGTATPFLKQRQALKAAVMSASHAGMFGAAIPHPQASPTSAPGCSGGSTTTSVPGANGSVTITLTTYYDALCTQIENTIVWTASQSGSIVSGPATITLYSTSGTVTETASGQLEFVYNSAGTTLTGLSILLTSITSNGKSQGELGIGCSAAAPPAESCGVAIAADVFSSSVEDGANVSFTATQTSTGSTFSMQANTYQSGLDGLSISAATFPDWSIAPSSAQVGSVAVSGTQSGSTVSLNVTDSGNGGTATITGSETGTITGTLARSDTGATVATFTIDAAGNGTLTYGNGTQVPIVNYAVQG